MKVDRARKLAGDVRSVSRTTSAPATARWLVTLLSHMPECARSGSLALADRAWERTGATFRLPNEVSVSLPGPYAAGAREMYCRNVYLRTGLTMPADGWVVDLGANRGLFSVWAAMSGARVLAVEAQAGYGPEIRRLAAHNNVADRVHVEIALAGGRTCPGSSVGVVADDEVWGNASHVLGNRPASVCLPELMSAYQIERVGLLKMDIEGGEYAVLAPSEDLAWLRRVDQVVFEIHLQFGDAESVLTRIRDEGFSIDLRDTEGNPVAARSHRLSYVYCRRIT